MSGEHGGDMMHGAMHAMSHRTGGGAARDARGSGHAPGHTGHLCTCLGARCGAVAIVPPAPPAFALRPPAPARPVAPGRPAHEYVAASCGWIRRARQLGVGVKQDAYDGRLAGTFALYQISRTSRRDCRRR